VFVNGAALDAVLTAELTTGAALVMTVLDAVLAAALTTGAALVARVFVPLETCCDATWAPEDATWAPEDATCDPVCLTAFPTFLKRLNGSTTNDLDLKMSQTIVTMTSMIIHLNRCICHSRDFV